jgi:hypothetical protein
MHPHALHARFCPTQLKRHGHQPFSVALAAEFRDQAEKGNFTCAIGSEVEFQYADFNPAPVDHRPNPDLGVVNGSNQRRVVHLKAGEPQPRFANAAIERPVFVGMRGVPWL